MTTQTRASECSIALAWLKQQPAVGEGARQQIDVAGKAIPDAVLEDPTRLVDLFVDLESVRRDAPVGVAEELLLALRLLSAGAARFDRYGYVGTQLAALQGCGTGRRSGRYCRRARRTRRTRRAGRCSSG